MGQGRGDETERMPRLVEGYTELGCSKLKKGKGFLKPNFERGPNWSSTALICLTEELSLSWKLCDSGGFEFNHDFWMEQCRHTEQGTYRFAAVSGRD